MILPKQIGIAVALGLAFIAVHIIIAWAKLNDTATLICTLAAMLATLLAAYKLMSIDVKGTPITFGRVFYSLSLVQVVCVILLSLNSAYNPYVDHKPINFVEIFISLLIFAGVLPFIIALLFWFTSIKKRNAGLDTPK